MQKIERELDLIGFFRSQLFYSEAFKLLLSKSDLKLLSQNNMFKIKSDCSSVKSDDPISTNKSFELYEVEPNA